MPVIIKQENTMDYRKALAAALKNKLSEMGGKGISVKTNGSYYILVRGSRTSDEQPGRFNFTPEQWGAAKKLRDMDGYHPVNLWHYREVEEILGLAPTLPLPD